MSRLVDGSQGIWIVWDIKLQDSSHIPRTLKEKDNFFERKKEGQVETKENNHLPDSKMF